jgi:ABC-type multidrug transport system fused ATPase/permease subunit
MEHCRGLIQFQNVAFHYEGRVETLKNISFEAREGEVIAIVGPTGAGKSTLVSLIPRFYDVYAGRLLIDQHDIRKISLKSLRSHISIVLQEPLLFSGTIMENIRYGRLEAKDAEVMQAARQANAHEFITALPQGYRTELGERGAHVSGGERQRIAIARAFLKDARILILDEPTSSIDSKTEAVILDALDRLMAGRTTLMIAHRLSTVRRADQILVLDKGIVVQKGTHEELIAEEGLYRQLHEMQTRQPRPGAEIEMIADVAEVQ